MYEQFLDLLGVPFSDYPFLVTFIVSVLVCMLFMQIVSAFVSIFYRIGGYK